MFSTMHYMTPAFQSYFVYFLLLFDTVLSSNAKFLFCSHKIKLSMLNITRSPATLEIFFCLMLATKLSYSESALSSSSV